MQHRLEVQVAVTPRMRELRVIGLDLPPVSYEIIGQDVAVPANSDFAAIATVFLAMRHGRDLHIRGSVTTTLLRNLEEFQEAWAAWRGSVYRPIRVTCDHEADDGPAVRKRGAVFAFSGGVDGTFAMMRHATGRVGRRTVTPRMAMLVHGFDIPLRHDAAFEVARQGAQQMLAVAGVPLVTVRTNWRVLCSDWANEFGAGLASCLNQFSGIATHGVLGADEDYANLSLPWGSNPVTNHFLSGGAFTLWTEGGGLTRTRRVAFLAQYPELARLLRVCWEGPVTGRNCGRCEKCIRTKLNFMVSGFDPLCFDGPPSAAEVHSLKPRNDVQCAYLREILGEARLRKVDAPWVDLLSGVVRRYERGPSLAWRAARKVVRTLRKLRAAT